jgi:hypothetical protein
MLFLFGSLVISMPLSTSAQTGLGAGLSSLPCEKIIEDSEDQALNDWINFWLKGVWTGLNVASLNAGKTTKYLSVPENRNPALHTRILAYCYENPRGTLMEIALDFYQRLPEYIPQQ